MRSPAVGRADQPGVDRPFTVQQGHEGPTITVEGDDLAVVIAL